MGFPVCIEDPKYGRNALIFNAGVVLTPRSEHTSDPEDFGPVVIKLASILHTLEVTHRTPSRYVLVLSTSRLLTHTRSCLGQCESGTLSDTDKKSQLERILHTIHAEINLHGHCAVPVGACAHGPTGARSTHLSCPYYQLPVGQHGAQVVGDACMCCCLTWQMTSTPYTYKLVSRQMRCRLPTSVRCP
jgi:hypothetical protein